MATYPVVNTKTGEQKEVVMSVHDWTQWTEDNPDWLRDYSEVSLHDQQVKVPMNLQLNLSLLKTEKHDGKTKKKDPYGCRTISKANEKKKTN